MSLAKLLAPFEVPAFAGMTDFEMALRSISEQLPRGRGVSCRITDPSFSRKPERIYRQAFGFRNDTNDLGHWIPAKAGMTISWDGLLPLILNS